MNKFYTLEQAKIQFIEIKKLKLKGEIKNQIERAALSVCLNLIEGNARNSTQDRKRFFNISYASQKEVQLILELIEQTKLYYFADKLGGLIYSLQLRAF